MKILNKIQLWQRDFFRKRRFSMQNATDNCEEWYIHISPMRIIAGLLAFVLVFFILILTLMAYTPVLEFLPGYRTEADRTRESLMQNIIRLDSMEQMMNDMMTYNENIALIMEGKTPVARSITTADSARVSKVAVLPSKEDSLLRAQMEGDGAYSLKENDAAIRRKMRETMGLTVPAEGLISTKFDLKASHYGISISMEPADRITAIDNGTVIQSLWTPEQGYITMLQHAGNLVSVYRNQSRSLVEKGQSVRGGEQIGVSLEKQADDTAPKYFEFELWVNGKPADPEEYILF